MARPSEYTKAKGDLICKQMITGKGLLEICRTEGMPDRNTVYRWLERHAEFRDNYARAREALMDFYAEQILVIAFDESGDIVIEGERTVANHAKVQRDRLKVDSLKWIASKLFPRQYGDKLLLSGNKPGVSHEAALLELEKDAPRSMTIGWRPIERTIVEPETESLRNRIRELEEELGLREREKEPKLLTYNPGPLPATVDPVILGRVVSLIRDCVPQADIRPADEVLAEVESVCRKALSVHYTLEACLAMFPPELWIIANKYGRNVQGCLTEYKPTHNRYC